MAKPDSSGPRAGVQPRFLRQPRRSGLFFAGCGCIMSQGWVPAFAGTTKRGRMPVQQGQQARRQAENEMCACGSLWGEGAGWMVGMRCGGSFRRLAFIRAGPASERPFIARICVRARARVGAGAVRAPDCARARQAQDAPRLSADSGVGPRRAGAGGTRLRTPPPSHARTPPSTGSGQALPSYPDLFRVSMRPPAWRAGAGCFAPSGTTPAGRAGCCGMSWNDMLTRVLSW